MDEWIVYTLYIQSYGREGFGPLYRNGEVALFFFFFLVIDLE